MIEYIPILDFNEIAVTSAHIHNGVDDIEETVPESHRKELMSFIKEEKAAIIHQVGQLVLQGASHERIRTEIDNRLNNLKVSVRTKIDTPLQAKVDAVGKAAAQIKAPPVKSYPKQSLTSTNFLPAVLSHRVNPADPYSDTPVYNCRGTGCEKVGDLSTELPSTVMRDLQNHNYVVCDYVQTSKTRLQPNEYKPLGAILTGTKHGHTCFDLLMQVDLDIPVQKQAEEEVSYAPPLLIQAGLKATHVAAMPFHLVNRGVEAACSTSTLKETCETVAYVGHVVKQQIPEKIRHAVSDNVRSGELTVINSLTAKGVSLSDAEQFVQDSETLISYGVALGVLARAKKITGIESTPSAKSSTILQRYEKVRNELQNPT